VVDLVANGPPTAHAEGRLLVVSGAGFRDVAPVATSGATPAATSSSHGTGGRGPLVAIVVAAVMIAGIALVVLLRARRTRQ
jgi:hypothetical protein